MDDTRSFEICSNIEEEKVDLSAAHSNKSHDNDTRQQYNNTNEIPDNRAQHEQGIGNQATPGNENDDLHVDDSLETRTINKLRAYTHDKLLENMGATHWSKLQKHHTVIRWRAY